MDNNRSSCIGEKILTIYLHYVNFIILEFKKFSILKKKSIKLRLQYSLLFDDIVINYAESIQIDIDERMKLIDNLLFSFLCNQFVLIV
jgi:hypothetical protein